MFQQDYRLKKDKIWLLVEVSFGRFLDFIFGGKPMDFNYTS